MVPVCWTLHISLNHTSHLLLHSCSLARYRRSAVQWLTLLSRPQCVKEVKNIWGMFLAVDATQIEINPLIETPQGQVVAVDAKIQFDDNAEFR